MLDHWEGAHVGVLGLGVSNAAAARYLLQRGAVLTGHDRKDWEQLPAAIRELQEQGMDFCLGPGYLEGLERYRAVLLSPGIPKRLPELVRLRHHSLVFGEVDLVFQEAQAPILGITGSSGKTTTTSLVGAMLAQSGTETVVGGNIGVPLVLQAHAIPPTARIILELSSFQLEWLHRSPHGALVTNISENHLDNHGTMAAYIAAKRGILRTQTSADFAVLNYDDPVVRGFAHATPGRVCWFSRRGPVPAGAWLHGSKLLYRDEHGQDQLIAERSEIPLPGEHNVENVLAAVTMARQAGASWEGVRSALRTFAGVPHRLEWVADIQGVSFYNDSIATSPTRSMVGTASFERPVLLLAGGYDKQLNYEQWAQSLRNRVKALILLGSAAPILQQALVSAYGPQAPFPVTQVTDLDQAVALAWRKADPGDVVLLSPACASFDQYQNFEERGEHFRQLVQQLRADTEAAPL